MVSQMPVVQCGDFVVEIIAHQRDGQVGGTFDEANAQPFQCDAKFGRAVNVDRSNAYTTFLEIFLCGLRRQAQARPISCHRTSRRAQFENDVAAIRQPLQGLVDFIGRKILREPTNVFANALSAFSDCGCKRTIKPAVQKEFPILRIEAHDIRWQHINRKIRRETGNAIHWREIVPTIAGREPGRALVSALVAGSVNDHLS